MLDGDGSALMKLGTMGTIGAYAPENLIHVVMDNGTYESTGGQPTISPRIDLAKIADSCGYQHVARVEDGENLAGALAECATAPSPHFILAKVGVASLDEIPRVSHSPTGIRDRFKSAVRTKYAGQVS